MRNLLTCFFCLVALSSSGNDELVGKVTSVVDGNTIEVLADSGDLFKVVIFGIDCPELGQDYGEAAKEFAEKIFKSKKVEVKLLGKDRFGNHMGVVTIKGKDPRIEILKEGFAWTAEKNPILELEEIREAARQNSKGLWKDEAPVAPWIFRRQQSMASPKSS